MESVSFSRRHPAHRHHDSTSVQPVERFAAEFMR